MNTYFMALSFMLIPVLLDAWAIVETNLNARAKAESKFKKD